MNTDRSNRALVVEDDADIAAYTTSVLEADGWAVQSVATCKDALEHAAAHIGRTISISWVATEQIASHGTSALEGCAGIVCSPGSPYRSMEGALAGIRFARERGVPFTGT